MSRMFLVDLTKSAVVGVVLCALSAKAQTAEVPLATYTDPTTRVSFQYPAVWKKVLTVEAMTPPQLIQRDHQPRVIVEFSPKGNLYQKTNLVSLDFLYATTPTASKDACYQVGEIDVGESKKRKVTIDGVTYQQDSGGGAAACHEMGYDVYATYRNGVCHLFEADFMTVCAGVVEGTRGLTAAETKALQRHLDAIMQSVRFDAPR